MVYALENIDGGGDSQRGRVEGREVGRSRGAQGVLVKK